MSTYSFSIIRYAKLEITLNFMQAKCKIIFIITCKVLFIVYILERKYSEGYDKVI